MPIVPGLFAPASANSPIPGRTFADAWPGPGGTASSVAGMKRTHALVVAIVVAFAAIAGTFAALRTMQLGANARATSHLSAAQIADQNLALDRAERTLLAELHKRPPALPPLPASSRATAVQVAAAPQTVIYHRPPTIVHVIHGHGGEHEGQERSEAGGMDD